MTVTVSGTSITFNDATVQTTAAVNPRQGVTTVTLTSAAPNATLTAASNQYILILNDATLAVAPSLTLPNMTTLPVGTEYFVFGNTTLYNVALKDAGGTVREYIAPGANFVLNIKDISTSAGQWNVAFPANAVSVNPLYQTTPASNVKITAGTTTSSYTQLVRLTSTEFALVWVESTSPANGNSVVYARLFTVNPTTRAITAGNTVTVYTSGTGSTTAFLPNAGIVYDTDNAGHALVLIMGFYFQYIAVYFGLSVSGGTLYATTVTSVNAVPDGGAGSPLTPTVYIGYLGSSSAYALAFALGDTVANALLYIRGCTVTGTTAPVLTNSASNTSIFTVISNYYAYGARTSLTTFVCGAVNTVGRAVSYTPASNTFTVTTRTNQARLDIEQGAIASLSSFANGGFMFSTGKAVFGDDVYDVANVGAAGVTTVLSTGFNYKPNYASAYLSLTGANVLEAYRSSIYVSGTSIIAVGYPSRFQCDPSQTTLNLQESNGIYGVSSFNTPVLLSTTLPIFWTSTVTSGAGGTFTATTIVGDAATPITL